MLFAHVSAPQTVFAGYFAQPPAPSQRPFVPHEAAPWFWQIEWLSRLFDGKGVQVPRVDASAQLWQAPPQALLQQTPSTQKPEAQSAAFMQEPPCCMGPQLWFTQAIPAVQSASVMHDGLQAPFAHRKGVQSWSPGGLQLPSPSQVPGVFKRSPAHEGKTHTVSAAYIAQAPKPSQVPVWPHFAAPLSLQMLRGSGLPGSMGQQVPRRPVWLHDTHAPWQASAQQTPSVQKPEAQSELFVQLEPFILRPQLPFMHCTPRPQSLFVVQAPKQSCLLTSHEYGEHTFGSAGAHVPAPSHV